MLPHAQSGAHGGRLALFGRDVLDCGPAPRPVPTRRGVDVIEHHQMADGRTVVKVHPLAHWTREDVQRYIHRHRLPRHPLSD